MTARIVAIDLTGYVFTDPYRGNPENNVSLISSESEEEVIRTSFDDHLRVNEGKLAVAFRDRTVVRPRNIVRVSQHDLYASAIPLSNPPTTKTVRVSISPTLFQIKTLPDNQLLF